MAVGKGASGQLEAALAAVREEAAVGLAAARQEALTALQEEARVGVGGGGEAQGGADERHVHLIPFVHV